MTGKQNPACSVTACHHLPEGIAGFAIVCSPVNATATTSGVTIMLPLSSKRTVTRAPARRPAFAAISFGRRRPSEFPHLQILIMCAPSSSMIANEYKLGFSAHDLRWRAQSHVPEGLHRLSSLPQARCPPCNNGHMVCQRRSVRIVTMAADSNKEVRLKNFMRVVSSPVQKCFLARRNLGLLCHHLRVGDSPLM